MADSYKCSMCSGVFGKGRSDKEALNESKQYFGEIPPEERVVVCEDCFKKIHPNKFPIATKIARAAIEHGQKEGGL